MMIAWVLGSSGLLGSALSRVLLSEGTELFVPEERLSWTDGERLSTQIADAVRAFARRSIAADRWEIYWAAGTGTMGSSAESLVQETQALKWLLLQLESSTHLMPAAGALALASSAGAIYAGVAGEVITEETPPAPTTAYAEEKLKQEELLRVFVQRNPSHVALAARLSTLYGAGQATGKKQGLLAHMARSILRNQPIQIYVPFDTVRDYIDAGDAAIRMVGAMRMQAAELRFFVKIIASETPVSIAEIISIFKRVARRNPRIVTSASRLSALYARRVQFRSVVWPEEARATDRRLPVGIAQLLMAERKAFIQVPARRPSSHASPPERAQAAPTIPELGNG